VKEGGVAFGNDPDMSARVVEACRGVTRKPLITKLSPNQTDIAGNARGCIEAGTDAFAVINTLMGMAIDIESRAPIIGNNQGGLSGPAIKPIALLKVHQVHQVCRATASPSSARGASPRRGRHRIPHRRRHRRGGGHRPVLRPLVCKKINAGIVEYLERHGLTSVSQLTGTLRLNAPSPAPRCGC
jgi:dihydroorotate dehydrogenase (NAD+) catalytic subunit